MDAWLLEQDDAFRPLFKDIGAELVRDKTDTNPLFAAALPNKFVCIVPSKRARELAEAAIAAARRRAGEIAEAAANKVFAEASVELTAATRAQIGAQLAEFPETFWAAATWPMAEDMRDTGDPVEKLQAALAAIHPDLARQGVFHENTWPVLTKGSSSTAGSSGSPTPASCIRQCMNWRSVRSLPPRRFGPLRH